MVLSTATCMCFFFFNDTATTEIYTLSLHDALPIYWMRRETKPEDKVEGRGVGKISQSILPNVDNGKKVDRKSTRLNSSHANISYAVFCLKKKKTKPFTETMPINKIQSPVTKHRTRD